MSDRLSPLRLLSLNCQGLCGRRKRVRLFTQLHSVRPRVDALLLQETHHSSQQQADGWLQQGLGPGRPWRGSAFWAAGSCRSRGVAIFLPEGSQLGDPELVVADPGGRFVAVRCVHAQVRLLLVCVYAPASASVFNTVAAERDNFFAHVLLPALPFLSGVHMFMGGDFNCVGGELDVGGLSNFAHRSAGFAGLKQVMDLHGLVDVWRQRNPSAPGLVTHTVNTKWGPATARLDRWLVAAEALGLVSEAGQVLGWPGDHTAVSLGVCSSVVRGPGSWALPVDVLADPEYLAEVRGALARLRTVVPVDPAAPDARRRFWQLLKTRVQLTTRQFCLRRARLRRAAGGGVWLALRRAHQRLSEDPTPESWAALQLARADWDFHLERGAALEAVRAQATFQTHGESSSFLFWRTHNAARARATVWTEVADWRAAVPTPRIGLDTADGAAAAGDVMADFFATDSVHGGLYAVRPTDSGAQDQLLSFVVGDLCLSATDAQRMEGASDAPVTFEEMRDAVRSAALGKSPGPDGLPYEFYAAFWEELGGDMLAMLHEAFAAADGLLPEMLAGNIVLLYKGAGDSADLGNFRPITLLNADLKLLSRALVSRFAAPLAACIDVTQSGFLPGRWIGDNVLFHQHVIDHLEEAQLPGCLAFLDFKKAYDRVDRGWVRRCCRALGCGPRALRWVDVLLAPRTARVMYNGWLSRPFLVGNGVPQGDPLSPLLYIIALQPLSAALRDAVARGSLRPVLTAEGRALPPAHMLADDVSLALESVEQVEVAMVQCVRPFCAASGSALSLPKCAGMAVGSHPLVQGVHASLGFPFLPGDASHVHLGVPLCRPAFAAAASRAAFEAAAGGIRGATAHWSAHRLSLVGRSHVGKQALYARLVYLATFLLPPSDGPATEDALSALVMEYVSAGRVLRVGQRRSRLLLAAVVQALHWKEGGASAPHAPFAFAALRIKVLLRLLHPGDLPWKALARRLFVPPLGLGLAAASRHPGAAAALAALPSWWRAAVKSFWAMRVHRSGDLREFDAVQVGCEFLRSNPAVAFVGAASPDLHGATRLRDVPLQRLGGLVLPASWHDKLLALARLSPVSWAWWQHAPSGLVYRVGQHVGVVATYECGLDGSLRECVVAAALPAQNMQAVAVLEDAGRGAGHAEVAQSQSQGAPARLLLLGQVGSLQWHPSSWAAGAVQVSHLSVAAATRRLVGLAVLRAARERFVPGVGIAPRVWPLVQQPGGGLYDLEASWAEQHARHRRSAPRAPPPDYLAGAAWRPSAPRAHWRERAADRRAAPPPPPLQPEDDALDALAPPPPAAPRPAWAAVWRDLAHPLLPRVPRVTAWRLMHAVLPCAAKRALYSSDPCDPCCPMPACAGRLQTLSHALLDCPVAASVWAWLSQLWAAVAGAPGPPLCAAVLLGGDRAQWDPGGESWQTWVFLRVVTVHVLHRAATAQAADGRCPARVAAEILAAVRGAIRYEWTLVAPPPPGPASVPESWLRGRTCHMTREAFVRRWALRDVLCSVTGPSTMVLHVRSGVPIPLPAPLPGAPAPP